MLQRIQTVYLALSLIFMGLIGWLPMGELAGDGKVFNFSAMGIVETTTGEQLVGPAPLMFFLGLIIGINLVAFFSFKNRIRQMRLTTFNLILMIGFIGVSLFLALKTKGSLDSGIIQYKIALVFPAVSAILSYLAIRAIGKDEALVRSIDRIR